jgi:hypothetical protein
MQLLLLTRRVLDRFFSGIPHPHLLGDLAPDIFFGFYAANRE